ncbi:MAG TPA: CBS domain-containing protein [Deltaproteobacteria bacterium]|nr:CBS domain-containing protein [Deltaproteobacteria bacterium]
MQIREIMTPNPEEIPVMESVALAAEKMKKLDVGAIPVYSEDRKNIVGMVTDRDIVTRAIAEHRNPAETSIRDIMSKDVVTCMEDTDIDEAVQTMKEKKVRRLIVTNARGETVGILSLGDISTKAPSSLEKAWEVLEEISEPSRPKR